MNFKTLISSDNIKVALQAINLTEPDYAKDEQETDLLTNLLHHCDRYGLDFDNQLRIAYSHYREEARPTDTPVNNTIVAYISADQLTSNDIGRAVRYIPIHASDDPTHADCEDGKLLSWNEHGAMIDYGRNQCRTNFSDLIWNDN